MWGCSSQPLSGVVGSAAASVHPLDCPLVGPDEPFFLDASSGDGIDWEYEHAFTDGDQWPDEFSMGLVADDFDGDGWVDLYITNRALSPSYFRNTGSGRFEEVPDAGGADPGPLSTGATAADVDGDGDPDLLVMLDTEVRLYRNDDGAFVDVTEESGLVVPERTVAVTWSDLDGDGDLDAYFCSFFTVHGVDPGSNPWPLGGADRLFLNDGGGHFTEASDRMPGAEAPSGCFAVVALDFDGDGSPEIATSYAKGEVVTPDHYWVRSGKDWRDTAAEASLQQAHSGMGLAWGDFDGDEDFDLWKTNGKSDGDRLLMNAGPNLFVDASLVSGIYDPARRATPHDADAWDFDDDGDLDVFIQLSTYLDPGGTTPTLPGSPYHEMYWNDGSGNFSMERSIDQGIWATELSRSMVRADFNGDGGEDIAIPYWDAGLGLYFGRCSGAGFVRVDLRGPQGNPRGVGARVEVEASGRVQVQEVTLGGQTSSSQSPTLRFGLGGADRIDRITVVFPSGAVSEVLDLPTNARVLISSP